jgi:hypothetical protein
MILYRLPKFSEGGDEVISSYFGTTFFKGFFCRKPDSLKHNCIENLLATEADDFRTRLF